MLPQAHSPKVTDFPLATIKNAPSMWCWSFLIARQRRSKAPLICISPDLTNEFHLT